jgi:hypothetical protein
LNTSFMCKASCYGFPITCGERTIDVCRPQASMECLLLYVVLTTRRMHAIVYINDSSVQIARILLMQEPLRFSQTSRSVTYRQIPRAASLCNHPLNLSIAKPRSKGLAIGLKLSMYTRDTSQSYQHTARVNGRKASTHARYRKSLSHRAEE